MISFEVSGYELHKDAYKDAKYKTIVTMMCNGCTIDEMAEKMSYTRSNISYYINKLFKLFNATNRAEFLQKFFMELLERQNKRHQSDLNTIIANYKDLRDSHKHIRNIINSNKSPEEKIILIKEVL